MCMNFYFQKKFSCMLTACELWILRLIKKHQERKAKTQEGHLKEACESEKGAKTQEGRLKEACEQERGGGLLQLERNH